MAWHELINKELIVSPVASRVYRISAVLSVALFFGWSILTSRSIDNIPEITELFVHFFLFIGILGAATTTIGMEVFLFRFDNSHAIKQIFWFCVMLFPFLGAALYCFLVYSRSEVLKDACKHTDSTFA